MPSCELGAPAYCKRDIEAWMPSLKTWGEVSAYVSSPGRGECVCVSSPGRGECVCVELRKRCVRMCCSRTEVSACVEHGSLRVHVCVSTRRLWRGSGCRAYLL